MHGSTNQITFFEIGSSPESLTKKFFTKLERGVKQRNSQFKKKSSFKSWVI